MEGQCLCAVKERAREKNDSTKKMVYLKGFNWLFMECHTHVHTKTFLLLAFY